MDEAPRGSMSDEPVFQTIWAPPEYSWETDGPVRYSRVSIQGEIVGYLWAAIDDEAADFMPKKSVGPVGNNAAVAWTRRLRWAKAQGLSPLEVLTHWAGEAEDPECGFVPAGNEQEAAGLQALKEHAAR